MKKEVIKFTIKLNRRKKTYTIREYVNGRLVAKYRSYPQGSEFSEHWTESDIRSFLKYSDDYYVVCLY